MCCCFPVCAMMVVMLEYALVDLFLCAGVVEVALKKGVTDSGFLALSRAGCGANLTSLSIGCK